MLSSLPLPLINSVIVMMLALIALSACSRSQEADEVEYLNAATTLVDNEIFQVSAVAKGASAAQALPRYADCVAAQYTMIRGMGYLRRISGFQRGSFNVLTETTLYTLSDNKPLGASVIIASETVAECKSDEIPTF